MRTSHTVPRAAGNFLTVPDEAHKAAGEHSYVKIMRHIMSINRLFRLIALTATPGNTISDVQNVVKSLHISRVEIRSESDSDVAGYIHEKVRLQFVG